MPSFTVNEFNALLPLLVERATAIPAQPGYTVLTFKHPDFAPDKHYVLHNIGRDTVLGWLMPSCAGPLSDFVLPVTIRGPVLPRPNVTAGVEKPDGRIIWLATPTECQFLEFVMQALADWEFGRQRGTTISSDDLGLQF